MTNLKFKYGYLYKIVHIVHAFLDTWRDMLADMLLDYITRTYGSKWPEQANAKATCK